ncbi:hypothetical protein ABFS82_07G061100 [Erythranthe guttata]
MAHLMKKNLLPLLILLSTLSFQEATSKKCPFSHEYEVHVINYLIPTSKIPVSVHCESGNDDLGNHTIPHLNNEFNWSFCESIFHNTLFFCRIRWGSKYLMFDVYKSEWRDRCSTRVCFWGVQNDGIYFGDGLGNDMEKSYSW